MNRVLTFIIMTILVASAMPLNVSADASEDIPTNAAGTGVHDSLVAALAHANLVSTLEGTGPFTVFAPTDQAFADAGIDLADFDTPEENDTLANILLYHVIAGSVASNAVTDGMLATMANGDRAKFGLDAGTVSIGTATVTTADVQASNGIIHVIDQVLMPPADLTTIAMGTGIHDTLVSAVMQADLVPTLTGPGPFTLFAPTDQAFAQAGIDLVSLDSPEGKVLLEEILLYHVISGDMPSTDIDECMINETVNGQPLAFSLENGVMVNDANVSLADVVASNGIIHVIDKVLMPPADLADIPTVAQGTGIHTSLVAAVVQAELLTTLQGDGPFTVFAPTDDAFAAAGIDLAALDTEEGKAALTDILLYHVVSGAVPSSAVTDGMSAAAVNGDDLSFTVGEGVMVNDANVVLADVPASNGVIHVIDKVLMPPADEPVIPEGCDYVIGIDESGYAYDETDLSIDVGQTVCWIWEDESMGHNVAQIEDEGDTSRMLGGKYSGMAMMSVDYRVTFDEDQTFLYICEPHATMDMVGKVVVGTGVMEEVDESDYDSETDSVPGFTAGLSGIALAAAVIMYGGRKSEL